MTADSFRPLLEIFQVSGLNEGFWALDALQLQVELSYFTARLCNMLKSLL